MTLRAAMIGILVVGAAMMPREALGQTGEAIGIPIGQVPPTVQIEDLEGQPVDLGQFIGRRPVLVEFWALWCEQCEALLYQMIELHGRYGDQIEFLAVSVAVNQTPRRIKRHLERHPMPYRVLWDKGGRATRAFQAPTTSYVVVLDADGRAVYTGAGADQDLARAIRRVVKK